MFATVVINTSFSYSVDVFINFESMFAIRIIAMSFIISNSIPDKNLAKNGLVMKRILEDESRYFQTMYHSLRLICLECLG